ncbi:Shr3 amino acid permease chaperone [Clavulina sp. PMI_390]|nr:Shr3 amino acid permease chaperone [Clavulina sp. PMI_390]
MGFRQGAVLSATSFFLGVLFIAFNVDRRILYTGSTPSELDYADAVSFYKTFYEAPLAIKGLLHAVIGIGMLSCILKLAEWDESALFFDGTSTGLFLIGIIIYISVTIPTLRTVVAPLAEETIKDQREALSVLSAGNTLIVLTLVGVLLLQGGQEYARRQELKEAQEAEAAAQAAAAAEKKDQ